MVKKRILGEGQSRAGWYKSQKVDDLYLSQKIGFVCK